MNDTALIKETEDELAAGIIHDLDGAMNRSQQFVGTTRLGLTTFSSTDPAYEGVWILVHRVSTYFQKEGQPQVMAQSIFTFSLDRFEQLRASPRQPAWWHLLDDLLYRKTDMAARFVAQQLEEHGVFDTKADQWRTPRMLDFGFAMQPASVSLPESPEVDFQCSICTGPEADQAVTLKVFQVHRYHKDCILNWFSSQGPEKADCPLCRAPVVPGEEQARAITLGLREGVYSNDSPFTPYENFERSRADLDERSACMFKNLSMPTYRR